VITCCSWDKAPLTTWLSRSFQTDQQTSNVKVSKSFLLSLWTLLRFANHQSTRGLSWVGIRCCQPICRRRRNHTSLAKTHPVNKCWMVSRYWEHKVHDPLFRRLRRWSLSEVQQWPRMASQKKNLQLGDALVLLSSLALGCYTGHGKKHIMLRQRSIADFYTISRWTCLGICSLLIPQQFSKATQHIRWRHLTSQIASDFDTRGSMITVTSHLITRQSSCMNDASSMLISMSVSAP
jgi:hypothetical protein